MKKWMAGLGLAIVLTAPALAWRPAGWVYANYPYMYDQTSGDWYWFGVNNVQWANGFPPADGWKQLNDGPLARGWTWHVWPYAYHHPGRAWHYFSANGKQRCVNLSTGVWTVFGQIPPPAAMVSVPGGTNAGVDPDEGAYSLTVPSFHMDRTEVTKARWDEVRAWAVGNGYAFENDGEGKAVDHPVHTVNWYDCVKWCNARSEKDGRPPCYYTDAAFTQVYRTGQVDDIHVKPGVTGYRLPTADEREYAARGGVAGRRFPWADSDDIQHARANYSSRTTEAYDTSPTPGHHPAYATGDEPYTSPVASFAANGYGLFDMAGNLWEWCWTSRFENRVYAGGCWDNHAVDARNAARYSMVPTYANRYFGFRTVCEP